VSFDAKQIAYDWVKHWMADNPDDWEECQALAKLIEEVHAAGKREGIEAAAQVADAYRREDNTILVSAAEYIATRIRALLQTEEKKT
jgi:hypothetical protein